LEGEEVDELATQGSEIIMAQELEGRLRWLLSMSILAGDVIWKCASEDLGIDSGSSAQVLLQKGDRD
jgi:hypothetical protein